MIQTPNIGALVHSLAGRDSGEYYLIVGFVEPHIVLVANGSDRPLKSPKKKYLRHLKFHQEGPSDLVARLQQRKARDEEIVRAIHGMVVADHPGGEREGNKPDVKEKRRY
ncbi:MAG: RNA-binding protein [Firmicutes bacterium]|nr:RNA-binding protein [Bacillota bacterium]